MFRLDRNRIKAELARRGMTQRHIAGILGQRERWINDRVAGIRSVRTQEIVAIANTIGCTPRDLIDDVTAENIRAELSALV
jgi:transcriptional regulator with XRE-family HTH domain